MRIGVKETVLEKLLEIGAYKQSINLFRGNTLLAELVELNNFGTVDVLHRQHLRRSSVPEDLRHVDVGPVPEILTEPLGIAALRLVVHLLVDRLVEFAEHPRPVGIFVELREAFSKVRDTLEYMKVALDRRFEVRTLHFYSDFLTGEKACT